MNKKYTTSDISRTLSVSERTARRYINKHIHFEGNKQFISSELYDLIINSEGVSDSPSDKHRTSIGHGRTEMSDEEFDRIEGFSEEEYLEFQKRLIEYPLLKEYLTTLQNELEYNRTAYNKLLEMQEKLVESIKQRNFIEAKEKGFDN